jgi:hypothetical protein
MSEGDRDQFHPLSQPSSTVDTQTNKYHAQSHKSTHSTTLVRYLYSSIHRQERVCHRFKVGIISDPTKEQHDSKTYFCRNGLDKIMHKLIFRTKSSRSIEYSKKKWNCSRKIPKSDLFYQKTV